LFAYILVAKIPRKFNI